MALRDPLPVDIDRFERRLRAEGFRLVAGVDEVGRGALAGPLVTSSVILPDDFDCDGLKDSKQLTHEQREEWDGRIRARAIAISLCRAYPARIDRYGLHVTNLAMLKQAIRSLPMAPDFVLTDGFALKGLRLPRLSVRKGDATCASVAAASIVAKVARDRMMERYHRRYPVYGFDRHRGYGTASHRAAIARFGPSPIHRRSFKGMDLYEADRETYVRLYARDDLLERYGVFAAAAARERRRRRAQGHDEGGPT
jgi:ribonuclease HII